MDTQLTVRLPSDLTIKMKEKARRLRLKRSDIIRLALAEFLEGPEEPHYPYERVKHLIGSVSIDIPDLGKNHRKYLLQKLRKNG